MGEIIDFVKVRQENCDHDYSEFLGYDDNNCYYYGCTKCDKVIGKEDYFS